MWLLLKQPFSPSACLWKGELGKSLEVRGLKLREGLREETSPLPDTPLRKKPTQREVPCLFPWWDQQVLGACLGLHPYLRSCPCTPVTAFQGPLFLQEL